LAAPGGRSHCGGSGIALADARCVQRLSLHGLRKRLYVAGYDVRAERVEDAALFERTAKLPRVDIKRPGRVIGSSTIAAMQSGLYHGYVGLVDGVLRKMIDELDGRPRVIATGGLASLIATGSELIELVDDTLTLEGLRAGYVTRVRVLEVKSTEGFSLWHDTFYYTLNQIPN
jgi:hypothetical protein